MANVRIINTGQTSFLVDIDNLSSPQNTYDGFEVTCDGVTYSIGVDSGYTGDDTQNRTISGLTRGKTYTITGRAKQGGTWYSVSSATGSTLAPDNPTSVSSSNTSSSITFSWSATGVDHYQISWSGDASGLDTNYSGTSKTISGLSEGDSVTMLVKSCGPDVCQSGWTSETGSIPAPPPPSTPTGLTITSITKNSMRWDWNSVSDADDYDFILSGGTSVSNTVTDTYASFSGLTPDTEYCLKVRACNTGGCSSYTINVCDFTDANIPRPSNWSWTTAENSAFNNNGTISTITYQRWNEFVERVDDFRLYYNDNNGTTIELSLAAYMGSSSRTMTATRFNLVRNCINQMNSTSVSTVSSGDIVYGSYFTGLTSSLNGIT